MSLLGNTYLVQAGPEGYRVALFASRLAGAALLRCWERVQSLSELPQRPGAADHLVSLGALGATWVWSGAIPRQHGGKAVALVRQEMLAEIPLLPEEAQVLFWPVEEHGSGALLQGWGLAWQSSAPLAGGLAWTAAAPGLALAAEALRQHSLDTPGRCLALVRTAHGQATICASQGSLDFLRCLPLAASEDKSLRECLAQSLRLAAAGGVPDTLVLPEDDSALGSLAELCWQESYGELPRSTASLGRWPYITNLRTVELEPFAGLGTLVEWKRLFPAPALRRWAVLLMAGLLLGVLANAWEAARQNRAADVANEARASMLKQHAPEFARSADPARQLRRALVQRGSSGNAALGPPQEAQPLPVMAAVGEALARQPEVSLAKLAFSGNVLTLTGKAPSYRMVEQLREALKPLPGLAEVKLDRADTLADQGGVSFQLSLRFAATPAGATAP